MTDEQPPDPQSRRARLASRRSRLRVLGAMLALVVLIGVLTAAVALREDSNGGAVTPSPANHRLKIGRATAPQLGALSKVGPPRALSHADPLRLWIGGDSLAGSFGPALGQTAGATGVVDATIDYKVSSGLEDQGIRDWYAHAQEKMASEDPDAVVFIIGTNDASIANTYDGNNDGVPDWEAGYREKIDRMMTTFVGGARKRTVFWLGPPTLGADNLDRGAKLLGPVMREEAKKFAPNVVYVDTYRLFEGENGGYSRYLTDAKGKSVQVRISDGVHFTVDGAQYLGDILFKLLDKRWDITKQAQPSEPIDYTIAHGSNDYVPGVGRYRPTVTYGSSNGSSNNTTSPSTETTVNTGASSSTVATGTTNPSTPTTGVTNTTTPTPTTVPHTTTPPTTPHTTPHTTVTHATTP